MSDGSTDEPIRDASTVIVLRESGGTLETFMLCRHQQSGFMGGAHVFPGGKVDPEDSDPRWRARVDRSPEEITARLGEDDTEKGLGLLIAGIRETFEEAGVLLASARSDVDLAETRKTLHTRGSFLDLADAAEMKIDALALTPYARWVTPKMESRRFDTRFYIAVVPEGQEASHDGSETTSAVWLRPSTAIDDMVAGKIKLAPPTVRTLRWLADFRTAQAVIDDSLSRKPPLVRPELITGDSGWFLALPGDPEHSETEPALPGSTRMALKGTAWVDVD